MSCDEAVLAALGSQTKTGYSQALVSFALARRVPAALAFGEHDAARRVKHVLKWKKETPRIAFLAVAAVLLVLEVCVNNPAQRPDEGYVWGVEGEKTAWSLDYRFPDDTRSFVFYMEIYRYGELQERRGMVMDGMEDNSEGVTEREGTFPLEVFREGEKTGVRFSSGTFPTVLTEAAESARLTDWSYLRGKAELNLGGSAAVAVAYVPGEGAAPVDCGALNREDPASLLRQCPVAVVLRLAVSRQTVGNLVEHIESGVIDLPAALYALRLDHALEGDLPTLPLGETLDQDLTGVRAILETLGVPDLDQCTLELGYNPIGSGEDVGTLRVYCQAPTDLEAYQNAMITASKVVPALVGDVDQVTYGYPNGEGRIWNTIYTKDGPNDLDEIARELGYRDIHAVGETLAGIQALVDDLWKEDLPAPSAAETLAQQLWALREEPDMELETFLLDQGLPNVDGLPSWVPVNHRAISWADDHTLSFRFDDPAGDAKEVRRAMEKKAVVLLALREDLTEVTWTWTPEGTEAPALSGSLTEDEADGMLSTAGMTEGIKVMGTSPARLARMLNWLEIWGTPGRAVVADAAALLDQARQADPVTLAEEVISSGPFQSGQWNKPCTLELTDDGGLYGAVSGLSPEDEDWRTQRSFLERCGILLLALKPELPEVRWADAAGDWWIRLDRTRVDSYLMEYSQLETRLDDLSASSEALADLMGFLAVANTGDSSHDRSARMAPAA